MPGILGKRQMSVQPELAPPETLIQEPIQPQIIAGPIKISLGRRIQLAQQAPSE